jgi:hypothetical protein
MGALVGPLVFPLGGEGLSGGKPWIVNLVPAPDASQVRLLRPVRFAMRDSESYIDPGQMLIEVGYAKSHSEAEELFDAIPRTKRITLKSGVVSTEPTIALVGDTVEITKTANGAQKSVYATAVEAGAGFRSAMVSAVLRPDVVSVSSSGILGPVPISGAVLGIEHGPRNRAAYLWFQFDGSDRYLRFTGSLDDTDASVPNLVIVYDWSTYQRYTMVWNEAQGYVEVYAVDTSGETLRIFRVPITSVTPMPNSYTRRMGAASDVVGIYGMEGETGDKSTWKNIAVTTDVGYPIIEGIRPGSFLTKSVGAELVRTIVTVDPREADNICWFDPPDTHFPNQDPSSSSQVGSSGFKMTKATLGKTFSLYRDEPGLLQSSTYGFSVEAQLVAENSQQQQAATGMGITIYDGISVFQIQLFNDFSVKTIGLRKRDGLAYDITNFVLPSTPFDWSAGKPFRLVVDARRNRLEIYNTEDLETPILDIPFDRLQFPEAADLGYNGLTPFVAFGHVFEIDTLGTLTVQSLEYSHIYQSWEAREGLPTAAEIPYTATNPGTLSLVDDRLRIDTEINETSKVHRVGAFALNRGAVIETQLTVLEYKPLRRVGANILLDNGLHTFALAFVDTTIGKFACVPLRTDIGGFREIVGRDGQAAKLSFLIDWTNPHIYRLELRPYDGFYVFVDGEKSPRIVIPEIDYSQLPDPQFAGTPSVAFGQFGGEGAVTDWSFSHVFFSGGYEISFKKNKSDVVLRDELFATQAIVVAYAADTD